MTDEADATVLVIDDEYGLRQSIVAYLEDSGFRVLEAEDGEQGLKIFHAKHPDIVLSDLQMPGLGGLDVLATISRESPETPVIVVSGAGGMSDAIEALRLGAWDYLTKPITDLAVLEHAVCKSLERSRLVEENRRYRDELETANAELKHSLAILQEDQEAGRNVQQQLLPEPLYSRGPYSFSHSILPSLYLSGDFIDYFEINQTCTGFYIADVSGHGASSAFVTVLLKSLMNQLLVRYRTHDDECVLNPSELLQRVSAELYLAKLGKYLTMIYGVIDHQSNMLRYSIGGHFPNPILHQNGQTQYLTGKGFPIGIFEKANFDAYEVGLAERFHLSMFSDGVLDILGEHSIQEKEDILLKLLHRSDLSIDALLGIFKLKEGLPLPDDVSMLLIERNA